MIPQQPAACPAPPGLSIGHVHLKVADLERAIAFYSGVIGLDVMQRLDSGAAFLSAGGYHHHIALNTWTSDGATPHPPGHSGLYHVAFRYPHRPAFAAAVRRVLDAGVRLTGKADHAVSWSVYFDDPDANGVELTWDLPREDWPRDEAGQISIKNLPLALDMIFTNT